MMMIWDLALKLNLEEKVKQNKAIPGQYLKIYLCKKTTGKRMSLFYFIHFMLQTNIFLYIVLLLLMKLIILQEVL